MKNILKKINNTKLFKFINLINRIDRKYHVSLNASSISFYIIISVISLLLLAFQIINISSNFVETFLIPRLLHMFSDNFGEELQTFLPKFSLNGFSFLAIVNIFWSSSRVISQIDRISDNIYERTKIRNSTLVRISSFFMFSMLMIILIFFIFLAFLSNYIITEVLKIKYIIITKLWQIIVEVLIIFYSTLIIYIYTPPRRTKAKEAIPGAIFTTIFVYLVMGLYVFFINVYKRLNPAYGLTSIISYSLIALFIIVYIVIFGLIINYKKLQNVNITKLIIKEIANNKSEYERRKKV